MRLFSRVQEARNINPCDYVNPAHVFVEQKKFDRAITMVGEGEAKRLQY